MRKAEAADLLLVQAVAANLPRPEREYMFAPVVDGKPVRRWRFDVAWPLRQLAVEIEGSLFTGGRHGGAPSARRDMEKYNAATLLGWRLLRVDAWMVRNGQALTLVKIAFGQEEVGAVL